MATSSCEDSYNRLIGLRWAELAGGLQLPHSEPLWICWSPLFAVRESQRGECHTYHSGKGFFGPQGLVIDRMVRP